MSRKIIHIGTGPIICTVLAIIHSGHIFSFPGCTGAIFDHHPICIGRTGDRERPGGRGSDVTLRRPARNPAWSLLLRDCIRTSDDHLLAG